MFFIYWSPWDVSQKVIKSPGSRCVKLGVITLTLSHTGHWKFNMAPHSKELSLLKTGV